MFLFFFSLLVVYLNLTGFAFADLNNQTSPCARFHTRPEIHAPLIHFDFLDPSKVTSQYLFLAPYRNKDAGPYIYDNFGNLVWSGAADLGPSTAHSPHVCTYKGEDHICYFEGNQHQGFARGHGVIMNRHYEVVKIVKSPFFISDMHEFRLVNGGKQALMTSYQTRQFDMTPFGLQTATGWIVDSVFYEIDVETNKLIFQWRALDHISPYDSYVGPLASDTSGDGFTAETPWDFFHINSIDKNSDGDYMISARHMSSVYKISGKDGSMMWALNGESSNFALQGFSFSHQHDARWMLENETHSIISIFDNSGCVRNVTYPESRGMVISLDHVEGTATLLQALPAPQENGLSALSQGNMQLLPDGHWLVGWGDHSFFTEYMPDGQPISYGRLAFWGSNVMTYRSHKFNWVGEPLTPPVLWTFAITGHAVAEMRDGEALGGMAFHVSWNGATEVEAWRFYVASDIQGPWASIATVPKRGFETSFHIPEGAWKYSFAEALGKGGKPLQRSQIVQTTVPSPTLALKSCDNMVCFGARDAPQNHFDVQLKQVFTVRDEYQAQQAQSVNQPEWLNGDGTVSTESPWLTRMLPSKKVASAVITEPSDDLPFQLDGTRTSCIQVQSCREEANGPDPVVDSGPDPIVELLTSKQEQLQPDNYKKYALIFILFSAVVIASRSFKRRSFRVRFNEKSLLG